MLGVSLKFTASGCGAAIRYTDITTSILRFLSLGLNDVEMVD